jgi:hypothetical protein
MLTIDLDGLVALIFRIFPKVGPNGFKYTYTRCSLVER